MKRITITLFFAATLIISARGQGFINLNFESAYGLTNPPEDGELAPVTNALPGWTAYAGSALSDVEYVTNHFPGVSTLVTLEGGTLAISGDFSVGLYGGAISQTGLVPDNAESLEFEAPSDVIVFPTVILGGQTLSYSVLSAGSGYAVYGANIPADMDGQMETLIFGSGNGGGILLDNIEFLPTSVPEPSGFALISLGAILFGLRYCRKLRTEPRA